MSDDGVTEVERELRLLATALVTSVLHRDLEAVDSVLLPLNEWKLRALCITMTEYVTSQIVMIAESHDLEPGDVWTEAVSASVRHPYSDDL